jgi:hypothetical protein
MTSRNYFLQITISEDLHGEEVASEMGKVGGKIVISIPKPKLWSPDSPHLYQVGILSLSAIGKTVFGLMPQQYTAGGVDKFPNPQIFVMGV